MGSARVQGRHGAERARSWSAPRLRRSMELGLDRRPLYTAWVPIQAGVAPYRPGRQRRSSSAFATTLTLLSAIAAPATTGLSNPAAANGIPSAL